MGISTADKDFFAENGFLIVRGVFSPENLALIHQRLDDMAHGRIALPQGEQEGGRATGIIRRKAGEVTRTDPTTNALPEVRLTDKHARRGEQIYPVRRHEVDEAMRQAALAGDDPFNEIVNMIHLTDHDDVFRSLAAHPNITAVLHDLIGPHVKLFFDHLYNKPPYGGANRYHQDGFFMFSDRTITCWIAIDDVTTENGCMRYIPETFGYGLFRFDELGDGVTARELAAEIAAPLGPGDAVFHDRWTLHATGPNETAHWRRGWAVHYTSAKSRFVYDRTDRDHRPDQYVQTPERVHWIDDYIYGNRQYPLVSGREFPGCV
jgi:phytanoyl-CoA hydroxylase